MDRTSVQRRFQDVGKCVKDKGKEPTIRIGRVRLVGEGSPKNGVMEVGKGEVCEGLDSHSWER